MRTAPIILRDACAFVDEHHRHCKKTRGMKFAIAAEDDGGRVIGVVIVGRPNARQLATRDRFCCEALRVCVLDDAPRNACSFLYGAAWRCARAMGYRRIVTYNRAEESGESLRGAGFVHVADVPPDPRSLVDGPKRRWEIRCA